MARTSTNESGIAGEYLVASELSRRGYFATVTLKNTKSVDILVTNETVSRLAAIQVKTKRQTNKTWPLSQKDEAMIAGHLFYVFVNLNDKTANPPEFYIVPSKTVAEKITAYHKDFRARGGKANTFRTFKIPETEAKNYRDRWDLLKLN